MKDELIIIRGGGDLATGIIQKFYHAGCKVLILEVEQPTTIRKTVALSQAIFEGEYIVEDMKAIKADSYDSLKKIWQENNIPIMIDTTGKSIDKLKPECVIDAIIAKKNLGTNKNMAPITIGIGPGFEAGVDVDIVIETMRGHNLGRLIDNGYAFPNTGIPGEIGGKSAQRVIHSKCSGIVKPLKQIGDIVEENEPLLMVDNIIHTSHFKGLVRGMIEEGLQVKENFKIADVDPRIDTNWQTISDKARAIGGGALDAYLLLKNRRGEK